MERVRVDSVGPFEQFELQETDFLRCDYQLVVDFTCSQCSFSKSFDNFEVGKTFPHKIIQLRYCSVIPRISLSNFVPGRTSLRFTVTRDRDFWCYNNKLPLDFQINLHRENTIQVLPKLGRFL